VDETCRLKRQFVAEASVKKLLYYDDKNILVTVATSMMLTLHSVSEEGEATETMKVAECRLSFSIISTFCPHHCGYFMTGGPIHKKSYDKLRKNLG